MAARREVDKRDGEGGRARGPGANPGPGPGRTDSISALHDGLGNQVVSRLLSSGTAARETEGGVEGAARVAARGGEALPPSTRARYERRFGADLGGVRVHAGEEAARAAQSVDAEAYTVGSHIVFGGGRYAPGSAAGERLLAHELAHALQHGASPPLPSAPERALSQPGDAAEREADHVAAVVAGSEHASLGPVRARPAGAVARQPVAGAAAPKTTLHSGMEIRSTGADAAEVKTMLRGVDSDGDGVVTSAELSALARQGRERGFQDEAARNLFRAGLDAAALAQIKGTEKGQQLSADYLDKNARPFLEKAYGTAGDDALEMVAPQAASELTRSGAQRIEDRSKLDKHQRAAASGVLRPEGGTGESFIQDTNQNGRIDPEDLEFIPLPGGGYRRAPIGQARADQINAAAGLNRAGEALEPGAGPHFPDAGPWWTQRDQHPRWLGNKTHEQGGPWKTEKVWRNEGGEQIYYPEWRLDTSRMKGTEALDLLLQNPTESCMDCAMGKQLAQLQRLRVALGDEAFNRLAERRGLSIGYGEAANASGMLKDLVKKAPDVAPGTAPQDYQTGWQGYANVYVKNPKLMGILARAGWSGEHFSIKIDEKGKKVALAHPFGPIDAATLEQTVKKRVVDTAAQAGYSITTDDVTVTFDLPEQIDVDRARQLAGEK